MRSGATCTHGAAAGAACLRQASGATPHCSRSSSLPPASHDDNPRVVHACPHAHLPQHRIARACTILGPSLLPRMDSAVAAGAGGVAAPAAAKEHKLRAWAAAAFQLACSLTVRGSVQAWLRPASARCCRVLRAGEAAVEPHRRLRRFAPTKLLLSRCSSRYARTQWPSDGRLACFRHMRRMLSSRPRLGFAFPKLPRPSLELPWCLVTRRRAIERCHLPSLLQQLRTHGQVHACTVPVCVERDGFIAIPAADTVSAQWQYVCS